MKMSRSKYDASFKRESVQMMESGMSPAEVSEKLGVHVKTLYRWRDEIRRDGSDAFPGKGNLTPADAELRKMHRRIRDLEEENAILKKATAIFAKQQK